MNIEAHYLVSDTLCVLKWRGAGGREPRRKKGVGVQGGIEGTGIGRNR